MSQDTELLTLQDKAEDLRSFLNNPDWLKIIGIGSDKETPCIFVYVNKISVARLLLPETWHNIPVKIRRINKIYTN